VIAGPPNAGKSSLLNVIAGIDRAIVSDVPGTTRDHIEVPLSLAGVPIVLTDTAGLRGSADEIEAIGVARALALIEAADVVVWLGGKKDAPENPRVILVHPKSDLPARAEFAVGALPVSSVSGEGIAELLRRIEAVVQALLPAEGSIALNRRQARHLEEAADALDEAAASTEVVLLAEGLRAARKAFDRLTGRAGVEDVLDALFSRFCLGK
jgi:tRNA modification GTPase